MLPDGVKTSSANLSKRHILQGMKKEKKARFRGQGQAGLFPSHSRNQSLSTLAKGHRRDSKAEAEAQFLQQCRPCCSTLPPVALRALIDAQNATNYKGKPFICLSVQV